MAAGRVEREGREAELSADSGEPRECITNFKTIQTVDVTVLSSEPNQEDLQLARMLTGKPTAEQEDRSFHPRKMSLALRFSLQNSRHGSAFSANSTVSSRRLRLTGGWGRTINLDHKLPKHGRQGWGRGTASRPKPKLGSLHHPQTQHLHLPTKLLLPYYRREEISSCSLKLGG